MNLGGLLRRNLRYHWRGNLAILLGVAVATLVFTGSLLVGDSLRGSLRDLVQQQLGGIDNALVAGRFMRQQAADKLPGEAVCPAILVQGTVSTASLASGEDHAGRSVPRVTLLGVDGRFWNEKFWPGVQVPDTPGFWDSAELG
ncbi:MAG: hypothetical protein JO112_16595, partial [Planctomycetes bacterium]|nr:hypothetical protein [Planctomycetota bacterium]